MWPERSLDHEPSARSHKQWSQQTVQPRSRGIGLAWSGCTGRLPGFQASLALLSNQALSKGCRGTYSSVYCIPILGVGATILG
jgi:hypothetical protein